jgi:hypothetical protein
MPHHAASAFVRVCLLTCFPVQMSDGRASVLPRSLVMCMPASSTPQTSSTTQTSSTPQYYGDAGGADGGAYPRVVGHVRLKRFAEGGDAQLLVCHEIWVGSRERIMRWRRGGQMRARVRVHLCARACVQNAICVGGRACFVCMRVGLYLGGVLKCVLGSRWSLSWSR